MKRFPLFLLFTPLTLSTVPAQADIIDDTIGNIQQAINDAYNPDTRSSTDPRLSEPAR